MRFSLVILCVAFLGGCYDELAAENACHWTDWKCGDLDWDGDGVTNEHDDFPADPSCSVRDVLNCGECGDGCTEREECGDDGYFWSCGCPPNLKGSGCHSCSGGWMGDECDECHPNWTGANCDVCLPNFEGSECDSCSGGWMGDECDECHPNWTGESCDKCLPYFTGENCDQCSNPHYAKPQCTTCLSKFTGPSCAQCAYPKFTGSECDQCSDPHFAEPNCTTCQPKFYGVNCDQCADDHFTGPDCTTCVGNWVGPQCNECGGFFGPNCDGECDLLKQNCGGGQTCLPTTLDNGAFTTMCYQLTNNKGAGFLCSIGSDCQPGLACISTDNQQSRCEEYCDIQKEAVGNCQCYTIIEVTEKFGVGVWDCD